MGYSFKTFLKHSAKDFHNQSVNPPVVRASTIIFKSMQDIRKTQRKISKIQPVATMIMEDKEHQQHVLSILTKLEKSIMFFLHQLALALFF